MRKPDRQEAVSLLEEIQQGNAAPFAEWFMDHKSYYFAVAFRVTRQPHLAEEALQAAMITVLTQFETINDPQSFSMWLYRVVQNRARLVARTERNRGAHKGPSLEDPEGQNITRADMPVDDLVDARRRLQAVMAIIDLHEDEYNMAIFKAYLEQGMPPQGVFAKSIGMTQPAVKSVIHRARLVLRKKFDGS